VLLEYSTAGNTAERDVKPNKSLQGVGSVEQVEAKMEVACPGVLFVRRRGHAHGPPSSSPEARSSPCMALGRRDGRALSADE
jgi:peroxidase